MWVIFLTAFGYEVDPWTPRKVPLRDVEPIANAQLEALIDRAIERVRRRCPDDLDRLHGRVARLVARETSRRMRLRERRGPPSLGHGVYSGWLETDPRVDRVVTGRGGIYADVALLDSVVLRMAGTAATVRIGDTFLGTDKIDHFLATGHDYWRWSRHGRDPLRAARRGAFTERTFLGRMTSGAFSYADLEANWQGMWFYERLFEPGSLLIADPDACVRRVGRFDWSLWVDDSWDELHNPSVYGRRVGRAVRESLQDEAAVVCERYQPAHGEAPVPERAPARGGPMGLVCPEPEAPDPAEAPVRGEAAAAPRR